MRNTLVGLFEAIRTDIDTYEYEQEIAENIDDAVDETDFFNLPIKTIYNIISYANRLNYDTAHKLILNAFEKFGSEAIVLLGNLKFIDSNPIKCLNILQLIKSSGIISELANAITYEEESLNLGSAISQGDLKELIEKKNYYEQQMKDLSNELKTLKEEFTEKEKNYEQTIAHLKEENDSLVDNMQKSQVTILTLQNQLNELETHNAQQTKQKLSDNIGLNTISQNLENLPKDTIVQKLKEQISSLVIELQKTKKELDDYKTTNGEYNVADLQKMLQKAKKENYKYKLENKELKKALGRLNSPSKSDDSEVENQSPSNSFPQMDYSPLNPQSEELSNQINSLQKEIEEKTNENEAIKSQNSKLEDEIKELKEQNEKLQHELESKTE